MTALRDLAFDDRFSFEFDDYYSFEIGKLLKLIDRSSSPAEIVSLLPLARRLLDSLTRRMTLEGKADSEDLSRELVEDLPGLLVLWGKHILRNAGRGGALAPLFAAHATGLIPLQSLSDESASLEAIQADLIRALVDALRGPADTQRYGDAALFLADTGLGEARDSAVAIVLSD